MKKKIIISVILLVAIIAIIVSRQKTGSDTIRVGVIAPLSGEYGFLGESAVKAIRLNAEKDPRIQLFVEDSKFESKTGLTAFHKLVDVDKIDILINLDSVTLEAITPLVNKTNLPVIQIFETQEHTDDSIFQMLPFSYPLFTELGKLAAQRYGKVSLVYGALSDLYATDANYFKKGIASSSVVSEIKIGKSSYIRSDVTKMLSENPDAFTLIVPSSDGIKFLEEFKRQKGDKKISLICDANIEIALDQYIKAVGPEVFDGCISTNLPNTMTDAFKSEYKKSYNGDPLIGSDWGYDAITIVKNISNKPKDQWTRLIQASAFDGASGHVQFDETGTRSPIFEGHIFKNGKFVKLVEIK